MVIGIIGFGRFGELLYNMLEKFAESSKVLNLQFEVRVYSSKYAIDNKKFFSLEDIASQSDVIIPCVPISNFKETIQQIAPKIKPGSLVIDVCSVKVHPVEVMKEFLDKDIDILATHPMFGPDSTKNGTFFEGLKFIYYPVRIKDLDRVNLLLNLLDKLGLEIIEMTPDEHDKQAAYTHAFAFLIGKIGILMDVKQNQISTKGFEGILYNQMAVENDTSQLFDDMMTYNPYTKQMRADFKAALEKIEADLSTKNNS